MDGDKARLEANKTVVRRYFDLCASRGFAAALELVADDARWWMAENGEMGKGDMVAATTGAEQHTEGRFRFEVVSMTAEDDRVSVEANGHARRKNGVDYDNNYHFLFRVADGRISEIREHHNTRYAAAIWADRG